MQLTNHSAVPVYTVSGSSTARPLPEWLAKKRKRSLKNDSEYASRVELLQDFEFEEASQCVRVSEDGQWVVSTGAPFLYASIHSTCSFLITLVLAMLIKTLSGTYKPQIHAHYLPHLSLSFARHTVSLNTTFLLLSSDYSKSLHLQSDRSIEIHTPQGCHYTTRIPRYGRDIKFDRRSAEALVPAVGVNESGSGEVFRLNLELGRYMKAYEIDIGGDDSTSVGAGALQGSINTGAVNTAAVAEASHNLLAFGTTLGTIELWDSRSRRQVGILQPSAQTDFIDGREEVSALEFDQSGLGLAAGSSAGIIKLYDLRSPSPTLKKDQGYGYPIQDIIFLASSVSSRGQTAEPKVLSSDRRIIKIWDARDGSPWTSVEPAVDINSVAWCRDSGMLLTANEGRHQHSFFIPQLGPAPKWCSFLDNLVEEMAEDPNDPNAFTSQKVGEIYDNYKFLTLPQIQKLNLSHLIGTTGLLRPYMHGYFVAQRLYEEAKLIADPFVWEEQRNKRIKEKIDSERESRIRGNRKVSAKVNKRLAEKILERNERHEQRRAQRVLEKGGDDGVMPEGDAEPAATEKAPNTLLTDPRFARLFQDEDFAIDETSREFQQLNPSSKPIAKDFVPDRDRTLTAAEEEALDSRKNNSNSDASTSAAASEDSDAVEEKQMLYPKRNGDSRMSTTSYKKSGHRSRPQQRLQPELRISSTPTTKPRSFQHNRDVSFGTRIATARTKERPSGTGATGTAVGEREITFAPTRRKKQAEGTVDRSRNGRKKNEGRRSASGNALRGL